MAIINVRESTNRRYDEVMKVAGRGCGYMLLVDHSARQQGQHLP